MKKNIYSLFLAVIALAAFTACSDSDNDYQWASVPGNAQVYFNNGLPSKQNISNKKNSFTVPVNRVKTADAITVSVSIASDDNFFTAPSSVSFNAGEATTNLTISYDGSALEYDDYKSITVSISDESYTTPYGASSYTFKAGAPSPFKSIGKGTMVEDYLWGFSTPVEILQNEENPYIYRVQNGYALKVPQEGDPAGDYIEIRLLHPGETLKEVSVTMEDLVYFSPTSTGYYLADYESTIYLYHPSEFTSMREESNWTFSHVLAYKEDGTPGQIQLAPRYHLVPDGRGYAANKYDDVCVITFPGFVPKDYSADIAANGIFTDFAGNVYANAIAEFGADATNVKAIVVSADADPDAVADALASGDIEGIDIATNTSTIYVPIEEGLSGKLMIVLVVFDETNAIKGVYSSPFEYYGGSSNPWQSIGIGLYTEDFISSVYGAPSVQYEVEIEENIEHPGLYRMVNPYDGKYPYNEEGDWDAAGTYNIEVNAEDPEGVYINQQATGINWGDGPISIVSMGGYYLGSGSASFEELKEEGSLGTLKDGIITLPVFELDLGDGNILYYQGLTILGSSGYYGCQNGAFELVLPEGVTDGARAKARANAKARSFAKRLYGNNKGFTMKQVRILSNKKAPLSKALTIAK
jgi:hypothetical protein